MDYSNKNGQLLIEFRNVTVVKNGRTLLDNVNLSISTGEHVAILGPNGAGKSTLLKTITREYYPVATNSVSSIRILGEELWNIFDLRNHLGIVSGELLRSAYRDFTCLDMILSGFFSSIGIWQYDEITPKMKRKARDVMEFLGVSHLATRSTSEVSTGEGRLMLIGRALVHDPPTLLLDEPSSSLDPRASHELRETLRRIASQGKSLVMITHNLSDIVPEINRIILIRDGKIVGDGKKNDMLTPKTLFKLFGIRLEVVRRNGYYYHW